MTGTPHLRAEDRPEFERILGEALRSRNQRPDPAAVGRQLDTEQLRAMAIAASAALASCAAPEYQNYVKLRDELRAPPSAPASRARPGNTGAEQGAGGAEGPTTPMGEATGASGAGLVAIFFVLAPVLAGTAAVIFLLIGYLLRYVRPDEPAAGPLIDAGWVFVALTAAGIVAAMAGLLLTALRNGANSVRASTDDKLAAEVDQACEAWRQALLERGVLPFLREAMAEPSSARTGRSTYRVDPGLRSRTPPLGYSRPGFSTGDSHQDTAARPSFKSPGYTSPDYSGPEHEPM